MIWAENLFPVFGAVDRGEVSHRYEGRSGQSESEGGPSERGLAPFLINSEGGFPPRGGFRKIERRSTSRRTSCTRRKRRNFDVT